MSCNLQTFSVTTCTGKTWIVRLDHLQPPNCLLQLALTSFDRNIPTPDLSQCPANSRRLSFPTLRLNTQQKGDEHPSRRCLTRSLTTQNGAPPPTARAPPPPSPRPRPRPPARHLPPRGGGEERATRGSAPQRPGRAVGSTPHLACLARGVHPPCGLVIRRVTLSPPAR